MVQIDRNLDILTWKSDLTKKLEYIPLQSSWSGGKPTKILSIWVDNITLLVSKVHFTISKNNFESSVLHTNHYEILKKTLPNMYQQ